MSVSASSISEVRRPRPKPRSLSWDLPGFGPDTRISTSFGEVPAKLLHERDQVRTAAGSYKRIQWMRRVHLDEDFLKRYPQAFPVVIRAGAFGQGVPEADVVLSPSQKVQLRGLRPDDSARTVGELEGRPRIMRKPMPKISYTLFHVGEPALIRTEGLWAQTRP